MVNFMENDSKKYKVYILVFPNGKKYVGMTSQTYLCQRWARGRGYKNQPQMRDAIQRFGWENVKGVLLCDGLTEQEAEVKEIEVISELKTDNPYLGYNIERGGKSAGRIAESTKRKISAAMSGEGNPFWGKHLAPEHKEKIRKTRKARNIQPVNKQRILCVETGVIYESTAQATRETGIHNFAIRRVCYGNRKTAGGFHWRYVD